MKTKTDNQLFIFGGCYSNFQATSTIYKIATDAGFEPGQIICTGDVVGYCAQPEKTVNLIKDWGIRVIAGNVEVQLREGALDCGCNFDEGSRCDTFSRRWFPFAQTELSKTSISWMQELKTTMHFVINDKRYSVIHGGVDDISEFIFESTPINRKLEIMNQVRADIVIAGHSGLPFIQSFEAPDGSTKHWINPGVIGMPANDGTTRCWYGIVNTKTLTVEIRSFEYDHELASNLMLENKLPSEYAHTLTTGIWDNCEILPSIETAKQGIRIADRLNTAINPQ